MTTVKNVYPKLALAAIVWCASATAAERDPNLPADFEASHEAMAKAFTHDALVLDDGARLAYHIREGEGPTLVLVPGSWGDYLTFNRLVPHLDKNLRIIIIELRGRGDSGPAIIGGTMESFADDVMRVIGHLDLKRYYLGGHSIGGMLTVEIAGRAPEGLVGALPMEGWTHYTVKRNAFGHITDYELTPAQAAERAANRARGLARLTEEEATDFATIWRKWNGYHDLETTPVPVLQLWGDRGQAENPSREVMQIPDLPNIDIFWIPNASHGHLVEQPEAVARAVNDFIRRQEAFATARNNPASPPMLSGDWVPAETHHIDFVHLPRVPSRHVVVSDVRQAGGVNQHNYLVHHAGEFWAMWSDGPGVEDRVGQRVSFATSRDGSTWSEPKYLTPEPPDSGPGSPHYGTRSPEGMRWISRGFWQRGEELYALASLDEAAGFFGPSLELHAFRLKGDRAWEDIGVIARNAINNFPPKRLPGGDWMMSRRTHDYRQIGVQFLVGGTQAMDVWESFPVLGSNHELAAEEPLWWLLPDGNVMALFRDNRGSGYLYRSFSTDEGRTWSRPTRTNFPDARSKLHGLRLSDGRYVLVSNSNPKKRDPLTLAVSDDGAVFSRLGYLVGGRHVDYPHVIEHDGHLLIAFAGGKQSVEVLKLRIADLERIVN